MSFYSKTHQRRRITAKTSSVGMTEQHHKESCDIHVILRQSKRNGVIEHVNQFQGTYGDFANAPDFKAAQDLIAAGKTMFETVPAHIRTDMENDPSKFIDFMQNPENREQIQDYGLDASHLPVSDSIATPSTAIEEAPIPPQSPPTAS